MKERINEHSKRHVANIVFDWVCLFLFFVEWLQRVRWHSWYTKTPSIFSCRPAWIDQWLIHSAAWHVSYSFTLSYFISWNRVSCVYIERISYVRRFFSNRRGTAERPEESLSLFSQSAINIKWPKRITSFSLFICAWHIYFTFFFSILACTQTCLK